MRPGPATAGRKGRPWRRFRIQVWQAYGPTCHLCDWLIDITLTDWRDPSYYTVDHLDPLADGGAPMDIRKARPAHRYCNGVRGTRPVAWARRVLLAQRRAGTWGKARPRHVRRARRTSCAW